MANFSDYLEQALLGATLLGSTYTSPATLYASLITSIATDGSFVLEVPTATGYSREAIEFSAPTSGPAWTVVNSADIGFSSATTPWGTIPHFGIYDASTAGNLLYWGDFTTAQIINDGDTVTIFAGKLTVRLD